jgi:hypothetical protein
VVDDDLNIVDTGPFFKLLRAGIPLGCNSTHFIETYYHLYLDETFQCELKAESSRQANVREALAKIDTRTKIELLAENSRTSKGCPVV